MAFLGTWQTRFISLIIRGDLFTLHTGRVFVEETTTIEALSFSNCGSWKIKEAIKIILKGSANFYASSKFSANLLKLIAEGQCTIAGHLSLENLLGYVRNDMITAPGARVNITVGATVAVGTFRNDSSWCLDGNLHLHVACFEQSEDALIFVKDTFTVVVYDLSEERCQGRIMANYLIMDLAKRVRFDSYIRVNQIEICVPHVNESRLTMGGQLEVLAGPLILKGRSSENAETPSSLPSSKISSVAVHSYPAFVLEGQLKAEAVIAPFLAVVFSTSSYSLLSGMNSVSKDAAYRTLISCNSLHTQRTSLIDSTPEGLFPEGILCATTWLHEGQIRFSGEKVYIITDGLVNRGRLTSGDRLQNHMREVVVMVENFFRNDAVFSADRIEIYGNGELQNTNRIFANVKMNIRLANFRSEFGQTQLEGTQPKLLSASNERTCMGGRIEGRGISTSKACTALNQHESGQQVRISARSRLFIDDDIIDGSSNIGFSARDAILFRCRVILNLLELTLGAAYVTEFVVKNSASIFANQLRITGSCKYLTVIIDGELFCESIVIDTRIRQVKIVGAGILCCRKSCNIGGDSVTLTIRDIRVTEFMGTAVTIASDGALSLSSSDSNLKTVSIYADSCYLQGRIFVEHKIFLKIRDGACHISGEILGTCTNDELSLECYNLVLTGTVANLDFLESYTRRKVEYYETGVIKNVKNIVFEAEFISLDGKIMDSESVIATGEEVNVEGIFQNQESTNVVYSMFGKKILFDGEVRGPARLELNGSEITFFGISNSLKFLDIDANLAIIAPRRLRCGTFNFIAHSAIFDGNLNVENFEVTVKIALFIRTDLTGCAQCKLVAPLILALNCLLSSNMNICSLIYAFEGFELSKSEKLSELPIPEEQFSPVSLLSNNNNSEILNSQQFPDNNNFTTSQNFIKICFHSGVISHYTAKEYDLWEKTTKIINGCFKNLHTTDDELKEALKRTDQMKPIGISLPTTSPLYLTLLKLLNEMHIEHLLMRNFAKLFHLMCNIEGNHSGKHSEIFVEKRERFTFLSF